MTPWRAVVALGAVPVFTIIALAIDALAPLFLVTLITGIANVWISAVVAMRGAVGTIVVYVWSAMDEQLLVAINHSTLSALGIISKVGAVGGEV